MAHRAVLTSISLVLRHQFTGGVPVYSPACAATHCTYAGRDGQVELT